MELIRLVSSCYGEYGECIELETLDADLLEIERVYAPPRHTFRVLLADSRLLGSIAVHAQSADEAELKRVFLHPSCRGRGLGKWLSLWAFEWARERGNHRMHIWSDVKYLTAHHLYRSLGARETGEIRSLGGLNDVREFHFVVELGARGVTGGW